MIEIDRGRSNERSAETGPHEHHRIQTEAECDRGENQTGPEFEERYDCTSGGIFEVTLTCLEDGYARSFRIGRHERPLAQ